MNFIHENERIVLYGENGKIIAEVDFPQNSDGTVNVNHTFVDNSLRGQGVAGKLMEELVSELRNSNRKAQLTCSYAISWFEKHSEYKDLIITS